MVALSVIWAVYHRPGLHKLIDELANYQLGFNGERYVAEELSRLIANGFEIYHDVPFEGFNLDHVLVGPPGVFVVETKTRSKKLDKSGVKEYRVQFDGNYLQWAGGRDDSDLEQVSRNAKTLSTWLGTAVGERVSVTPILTYPGWMINRTVPFNTVHVLNPKEIHGVCSDKRSKRIPDQLIRRICHQLEQKAGERLPASSFSRPSADRSL
jgi:hypothetical protein